VARDDGFLSPGIAQNVVIHIMLLLKHLCIRLETSHTVTLLIRNVRNAIYVLLDSIVILTLSMVNKCGFQWDGIAQDVNMHGWTKKQNNKIFLAPFPIR